MVRVKIYSLKPPTEGRCVSADCVIPPSQSRPPDAEAQLGPLCYIVSHLASLRQQRGGLLKAYVAAVAQSYKTIIITNGDGLLR